MAQFYFGWGTTFYYQKTSDILLHHKKKKEEAALFGEIPEGRKVALTRAVDKFIRDSSCRHMQSLASPL